MDLIYIALVAALGMWGYQEVLGKMTTMQAYSDDANVPTDEDLERAAELMRQAAGR
jgi:hypothetical protein